MSGLNPRAEGPSSPPPLYAAVSGLKTPPPNGRAVLYNGNSVSPRRSKGEAANQTQCRNIVIYGYCRYQDRGCIFNHDTSNISPSKNPASPGQPGNHINADMSKRKLNVESASFTPGQSPSFGNAVMASPPQSKLSTKALEAAVFTPRMSALSAAASPPMSNPPLPPQMNMMDPMMQGTSYMQPEIPPFPNLSQTFDGMGLDPTPLQPNPYEYNPVPPQQHAQVNPYAHQNNPNEVYYAQQSYQPVQYHLYAPIGPHKQNLLSYQRTVHDLFLKDSVREDLQKKAEASLQTLPNSTLPNVDSYHSLVPLDLHVAKSQGKNAPAPPQPTFGYTSWVYKATSTKDGSYYILRRLEGFRLSNEKAIRVVEHWKRVMNANVVTVHDAFTTRAFGDNSIVFVFDYFPLSQTIQDVHFGPNSRYQNRQHANQTQNANTEHMLWSYIVQIASALKTIHAAGLAARVIQPNKILLTNKNRIRINCCSVLDVLNFDAGRSLVELQQEDYLAFGRVILAIACNNPHAALNAQKSMDYVSRTYSPELKNFLLYVFNGPASGGPRTMEELLGMISFQLVQNFDSSLHQNDTLEAQLGGELENGRLVRLLCKFGFINERPEFAHDQAWSETGDRYLIKLFRDYVFHQVDEAGNPVIDIVHVLSSLNKLDAGTDERIMLVSRDEQNCLIVSFRELKRVIESSFSELQKRG
ncbi:PAB-dependent poly(A)-specific ribonuclease subunit 3 [Orbilia oligospora]|uniref:PAN2-PAN3 deadenylation complex subunit PAN3 n=1 Tax=Orbilia oligospora TaxID=2813651 RepID=A0A6G1LV67_ORBOL|nr:PAB-dependent poly(A)-specific ribonuclease subunit 3 [Orbilia oligospora]KAF3203996.1 PAB-dependent poly(A)-specific ribonuclease subunit 3 [Orbilia oligospora]KAF3204153.1 PAB-dependent poly(A)-specific ribonuclease subunit 3 [Orbilia oligospora]KAF3211282.1 PAB-dependent poly(A)-specific ribonuclease subunit 3 [Orbilia oligospora]KAF3235552.1 PAB-dependent poly(A)-specific ribonuclease subunit 3 [Orbilia oligospora]